jgi:hypothetical protein
MAELHESLIRSFRKHVVRKGLRESESPMPTFRPDIFAERISRDGTVVEQIAVEAEIPSTLFSEHTSHQLLKMDDFLKLQRSKRIRARGYLLVPRSKASRGHARSLLGSLFPDGTDIRVVEAA